MGIMEILGRGRAYRAQEAHVCRNCGRGCRCKALEEYRPVKLVPEGKHTYKVVYADEAPEAGQGKAFEAVK